MSEFESGFIFGLVAGIGIGFILSGFSDQKQPKRLTPKETPEAIEESINSKLRGE